MPTVTLSATRLEGEFLPSNLLSETIVFANGLAMKKNDCVYKRYSSTIVSLFNG